MKERTYEIVFKRKHSFEYILGKISLGLELCDDISQQQAVKLDYPQNESDKFSISISVTKNNSWIFYDSIFKFNPYKHSVPFLGHRQTVQTHIRRHRARGVWSGSSLVANRNIYLKSKMKKYTSTPKFRNGLVHLIRMGKSIRQMWVNNSVRSFGWKYFHFLCRFNSYGPTKDTVSISYGNFKPVSF